MPVHRATELPVATLPGREELWPRVRPAVRSRLEELAGPRLEWWARQDSLVDAGQIEAVVVGERAFAYATPRKDGRGDTVHEINRFEVDPRSWKNARVGEQGPGVGGGGPAAGPRARADAGSIEARSDWSRGPGGGSQQHMIPGLDSYVSGILGNLPTRAQHLLQEPFAAGELVLTYRAYWQGWPDRHFDFFCLILAGRRSLTMASGRMDVPVGRSPSTARWDLLCRRARVIRRSVT